MSGGSEELSQVPVQVQECLAWIGAKLPETGVLSYIVASAAIWLLCEMLGTFVLRKRLHHRGAGPYRFRPLRPRALFDIYVLEPRALQTRVLLKMQIFWLLAVAAAILILALARAVATEDPMEFARAGSLVVIVGLGFIVLAQREVREAADALRLLSEVAQDPATARDEIERAGEEGRAMQRRLNICSVAVSVAGTLIWGYGDQYLGALLPAAN